MWYLIHFSHIPDSTQIITNIQMINKMLDYKICATQQIITSKNSGDIAKLDILKFNDRVGMLSNLKYKIVMKATTP